MSAAGRRVGTASAALFGVLLLLGVSHGANATTPPAPRQAEPVQPVPTVPTVPGPTTTI
jgi:hypothetical protein